MRQASNTVDDFPATTFAIVAFCERCGRRAALDRENLPPKITIETLRRRLRCTGCGSRETSIRIVYTGAGGFRYGMTASPPRENASS
jgi:DNA-directed RNA polymerase subunit RPC12/RpoP